MLLKTYHDILQFPSFDWFTGHGILAQIPWTTNMVGVRVRENGLEAQILQFFKCF